MGPGSRELYCSKRGSQETDLAWNSPGHGEATEANGDIQNEGTGQAAEIGGPACSGPEQPIDAAQ